MIGDLHVALGEFDQALYSYTFAGSCGVSPDWVAERVASAHACAAAAQGIAVVGYKQELSDAIKPVSTAAWPKS